MPLNWNDKYCSGVDWMDSRHKELFKHIGTLTDNIGKPNAGNVVQSVLTFLDVYTKKHFRNEEKVMSMYKYPDLTGHKTQHTTFTYHLHELKKKIEAGMESDQAIGLLQRLCIDWWIKHINVSDKQLGKFLNAKSQ